MLRVRDLTANVSVSQPLKSWDPEDVSRTWRVGASALLDLSIYTGSRTQAPSLEMTLNIMRLFLSSLSLPSKMGTPNFFFFKWVYLKNGKCLFSVHLNLDLRFVTATTAHQHNAQLCLTFAARLACMVSENYNGINDLNKRHLVAGEGLGIMYCWWIKE